MIDKRETVSIDQIAISNMYSIEAIVRVLVDKGICADEDILIAIKKIQGKEKKTK